MSCAAKEVAMFNPHYARIFVALAIAGVPLLMAACADEPGHTKTTTKTTTDTPTQKTTTTTTQEKTTTVTPHN
jgi:hypothetical protein